MKTQKITLEALAAHWGMTPRRVGQLLNEMDFEYTRTGVDFLKANRAYIDWLRRDEPSQRSKRELMRAQTQRIERRLALEDQKFLYPEEARKLINEIWGCLRVAYLGSIARLHAEVFTAMDPENARIRFCEIHSQINGEMNKCLDWMHKVLRGAEENLTEEKRLRMLELDREIERLTAAIGPRREEAA